MNYVFSAPDRVMVGTIGEVGARLFLLQVREGRRLVIVKCEKAQLAALAEWLGQVLSELGRPGHLPEDLSLEAEYEVDFAAGEIAVAIDTERNVLDVTFTSVEEDDTLALSLTKEWAGALAIAITRLVEAGRPPCPLCGGPLDARGHDCPRTNGHRAPLR
ncbi:MAG TPA: DUF3090 family protein [Acidimicrobiales bacterium]|nr:DUF3090 family protein [Acidimicrobiales bacterium]